MKVFVLNRKKLMIIIGCMTMALVGAFALTGTVPFMAGERKMPIYCVDREDKVVSIT